MTLIFKTSCTCKHGKHTLKSGSLTKYHDTVLESLHGYGRLPRKWVLTAERDKQPGNNITISVPHTPCSRRASKVDFPTYSY